MKNEIRNNVILKILNHGFVFLINILMVRLLGGAQSAAIINHVYRLTALSFLCSFGLDYAVIRSIAKNPHLYRFWHRILTISSVIAFPVSFIILTYLPYFDSIHSQPLVISVVFTIGQTLVILFQGLLSAVKRFLSINLVPIFINGIFCSFLFLLYIKNANAISATQMMTWVAFNMVLQGLILVFVSLPTKKAEKKTTDSHHFKQDILHGLTIMISTLVYFVYIRTDHFFAEKFANPVSFGNYVQCGKIGQYFLIFASMVSSILLPFISERHSVTKEDSWKSIVKPYVYIMTVSALGIGVFGYMIFPFMFGPDFEEMHKVMNILLPGYLSLGILTLLNAFYIGKGKLKRMIVGDVLGLIILLSMNLAFSRGGNVLIIATISTCCYIGLFLFMVTGIKKRLEL